VNTKEMQKIVKFCQKNGIKRLKTADFEIEFAHAQALQKKPRRGDEQPIVMVSTRGCRAHAH
jgi:hypothetical protein